MTGVEKINVDDKYVLDELNRIKGDENCDKYDEYEILYWKVVNNHEDGHTASILRTVSSAQWDAIFLDILSEAKDEV